MPSVEQSPVQHSLVREIDYGTPPAKTEKSVTLSIDGRQVSVPEGTSIMRAAMETGIEIPKLCATDMLDAFGSCRLCLVEIDGRGGTPASCTTPVAEGMVVHTKSERLDRIRKGVMELYVSDHSVDSLDRSKYADVDLLDTAAEVGLEEVRYGFAGARHRNPGPLVQPLKTTLVITEQTAETHVKHILGKLELRSRHQVTEWVSRTDLDG